MRTWPGTEKRRIHAAERRATTLEMRKVGLSLRAIAKHTGVSHTQAHTDLQVALDDLAAAQRITAEQYRALQTERLHSLLTACFSKALRGDLDAIKVAASLVDQLSKLNGLYGVSPIGIDDGVAIVGTPQFAAITPIFAVVLDGRPELQALAAEQFRQLEVGAP